jgi:DNA-binding LacI/PurR family transcriptional regulator
MKDVAQAAGVTYATVSNVVRGKSFVAESTRQHVEKIIGQMGYKPNLVARGLVSRSTGTVGFVLPDITNPFYPEIALELDSLASQAGLQILLCNTGGDESRGTTFFEKVYGGIVDGLVVLHGGVRTSSLLDLADRGVPVVACLFDDIALRQPSHALLSTVEVDFYEAGRIAARHLVDMGHRSFGAILATERGKPGGHDPRLRGFEDELRQHGLSVADEYLITSTTTISSGRAAFIELLKRRSLPSAIFTGNDLLAIGASGAAVDQGLRIPDDVSFVGVDNIMLTSHLRPALTTVDVFKQRIATEAFRLLAKLKTSEGEVEHVLIKPALIERQSVSREI